MSVEPLSREMREALTSNKVNPNVPWTRSLLLVRYEATVRDVEAKLADCERRERAAVERAEALRAALGAALANVYSSGVEGPPIRAALAADDEARA